MEKLPLFISLPPDDPYLDKFSPMEKHQLLSAFIATITMRGNETIPEIIIITNDGNQRALTINDIAISCFYPHGSIIEEEVTCNSRYMLEAMLTISAEIR
jgi:hypothetical protein